MIIKTLERDKEEIIRFINHLQDIFLKKDTSRGISWTSKQLDSWFRRNLTDPELNLGMYHENRLLGTIASAPCKVKYKKEILSAAAITAFGVDPTLIAELTNAASDTNMNLFREKELEIFKDLYKELLVRLKAKKIEFIFGIPKIKFFKRIIQYLEKEEGWVCLNKKVGNETRIMGKFGVEMMRKSGEINALEAKASILFTNLSKNRIKEGQIRDSTLKDIPEIVNLLNKRSETYPIARIWTVDEFRAYLDSYALLNESTFSIRDQYPTTPFGIHMKVWEVAGQIKAGVLYEINEYFLKKASQPFIFIDVFALSPDLSSEEKSDFIFSFFESHLSHVVLSVILLANYEDFGGGYIGEQEPKNLLAKLLMDKPDRLELLEKKLNRFYLSNYDFSYP